MTTPITTAEMRQLFMDFFGAPGSSPRLDSADLEEFKKQIQLTSAEIKRGNPFKSTIDFIKGQSKQIKETTDNLEALDRRIKKAQETYMQQGGQTESGRAAKREIDELTNLRKLENSRLARANLGATASEAARGLLGFADQLVKSTFTLASQLQKSSDEIDFGATTISEGLKVAEKGTSTFARFLEMAGGALAIFARHPAFKIIGGALGVFGAVTEATGKKVLEYGERANQYLATELKKIRDGFKLVADSGVIVAGGLDELRDMSYAAGLDVDQFARVLKQSRESLTMMGVGAGEAAKRLVGVSSVLRNDQLGMQLRKLGFNAEEQGELIAQVFANLNAAGDRRRYNDMELASITAKLGKDMKVLADVTGEDAKRRMEQARLQVLEADMYARALQLGGPEAVEKLQRQLAATPDALKKGYMELVASGGQAITDIGTNVAMQQNPMFRRMMFENYRVLSDSSLDASAAQRITTEGLAQAGKYARENSTAFQDVAIGARLTGDSLLSSITGINSALILAGTKIGEGATAGAERAATELMNSTRTLTSTVNETAEATQKLKVDVAQTLKGAVEGYAAVIQSSIKTVQEFLKSVGIGEDGKPMIPPEPPANLAGEPAGKVLGGVAGSLAGGAFGAGLGQVLIPIPGVGAVIGGTIGATLGGTAGSYLGSFADKKRATGGSASGLTLVGERGPEFVDLPGNSMVTTNERSRSFLDSIRRAADSALIGASTIAAASRQAGVEIRNAGTNPGISAETRQFQNELKQIMQEQNLLQRQSLTMANEMRLTLDAIRTSNDKLANASV